MSAEPESRRETFAFHAYRSVAWIARTMPARSGRRLFRLMGRVAFELANETRAVVLRNQAHVLGRGPTDPIVRSAARAAFDSYARYWFESVRFAVMSPEEVASRFESVGADHLWKALDEGKGAADQVPGAG